MLDNHRQKLLFKTIESDSKVDDVDSDEDLGQKFGIRFLSEEEQLEPCIVVNVLLAVLYHRHIVDSLDFFAEN